MLEAEARGGVAAPPQPPAALAIWDRAPDAGSRRAALIVLVVATAIFLALVPLAKEQLAPASWFIPLAQSGLIINDLITAGLLLGQARLSRRVEPLVLVGGYLYSATMASVHMMTFPGVFSAGGLLGAGPQTTGYLHVFWHIGLPCAVIANVFLRERVPAVSSMRNAIAAMFGAVALLALGFTLLATVGGGWLPPMLVDNHYSSAFNLGRYGQWVLAASAALLLWGRGIRSVLDLWLVVMLCAVFFEIGLVSIFNTGRYDLGFYAGRVYALASSCVVLVMLLVELAKLHRQLAEAQQVVRSEAVLRESREALRLAMHGGRMAAWTSDLASGRTVWTPEVEQLTGWPVAAFNASRTFFFDRVHPADRELARQALEPSTPPGQEFSVEFRAHTTDDGWRWFECRGEALLDERTGKPTRVFGVLIDVTERKDSERAVATVLESITDAFFAVDAEWRFTYVNKHAERLLQRSRTELLGRDMWAEFPAAMGTTFQREYERVRERRETVSFEEYYPALGSWLEVRAFPAASGVSVYFRDVSARRKAQEELQRSEARYRLLADMIPQHIWVADANGFHNFFSRSWYEYTGTAPGQTDGEGWLRFLHPDDRERTRQQWTRSVETGEAYTIEYRFRGADGIYRWFIGKAAPLRGGDGRIVQWFGTLTDISERKQHEAERERLLAGEREAREEAERRRAELEQVTESRSRLMRGFSHDLRSPLGAADMSASLLEDGRAYGALEERQREAVRRIRRGIRTSLRLIDDLLELERTEAGQVDLERVEVELAEAARETVEMFQAQAGAAGLEIELRVPDGVRACADPVRVRQVLANLVSNAIKYAPRCRATVQASVPSRGGEPTGNWVALSVVDTGPGIPEDKRELIFQEYTRLDPHAQQGTGLGLAISRRIARLMGGDLTVESESGRGSAFTLWLPAPGKPRPRPASGAGPAAQPAGNEERAVS
ncbi:MAG TPA: PAS domain-containing protein [Ramlibacter sp.]|uniref:PAS domain-containing protein n=1 Tax=Ramlibacter sp. TaxID=1917967 RepID=UPI002D804D04|nr:PAS domain-containing protein [Ramlibacter sp.]HET8748905.1 PAS domain-containing protein [Ramlibacter sp.]